MCGPCKKEYARRRHLENKYGLDVAEYDKMSKSQDDHCLICGGTNTGAHAGLPLFVDHDHKTGQVRGLLCHGCNISLGLMQDNPALLRKAAEYLER